MTNIPLYIKKGMNRGKQVGYYNKDDKTYYKIISYKSNQMMQNPKHIGRIGISQSIIGQLQGFGCEKICIMVSGYEKLSFNIIITLNDFVNKSREENWDDKQLFTNMSEFTRIYRGQEKL